MLFSSPSFLLFFVIYLVFHFIVPPRHRVFLIIAGSTIFYAAWKIAYTWVPFVLTLIAYFGVRWIGRISGTAARRHRAVVTIIGLFLPLVFFKYANFIVEEIIGPLIGHYGRISDLALPLRISFVTFTLTTYVIDTYRREFPPATSLRTVLGYVLFFPHLIAGPILRPAELIPQIESPSRASLREITPALAIFSASLIKKLVFAGQIAQVVDAVYAKPVVASGAEALLAIYGFSVQIYCDFSGYTDMAIGLALILGVQLPVNFRRPYGASTIVDFWRRWHITLSFWLRDYLYFPLCGNRRGRLLEVRNILITTTLGGLWHGASWGFVIWGLLHGAAVSFAHLWRALSLRCRLPKVPCWVGVLLTFHFTTLAWVLFRAPSLGRAGTVLMAPLRGNWEHFDGVIGGNLFGLTLIATFFALHRWDDHSLIKRAVLRVPNEMIWPVIILCWVVAITVSQGNSAKFIYFDF